MFCTFSFTFIKGHTLTFSHVTICTHSFHNKIRWSNFIHKNILDSVETGMQIWLITTRESNFKIDNVHIFANYFLNGYVMKSSNITNRKCSTFHYQHWYEKLLIAFHSNSTYIDNLFMKRITKDIKKMNENPKIVSYYWYTYSRT